MNGIRVYASSQTMIKVRNLMFCFAEISWVRCVLYVCMPLYLQLFPRHGCLRMSVYCSIHLNIPISVHLRGYVLVRLSASVCFMCTSFTSIATGLVKQVMYSIHTHSALFSSLWLLLTHQTVWESESDTNYAETVGTCC